jgi:hypothetical protein
LNAVASAGFGRHGDQPNGALPGGPDKVDLVPGESPLITHAATMGEL